MNLIEIKKLTQRKEIKYTNLSAYKKRNLIFNLEIFYINFKNKTTNSLD